MSLEADDMPALVTLIHVAVREGFEREVWDGFTVHC